MAVPDEIRERMRDEIQDVVAGCASGYYQQIHPPAAADAVLAVSARNLDSVHAKPSFTRPPSEER